MKYSSTAVVGSTDSCRNRSVNKNSVGSDFFVSGNKDMLPSPEQVAAIDAKILSDVRTSDVILIDTCELMSPGLPILLSQYAETWRADKTKLSITPSVLVELFRNCDHKTPSTQQDALRGWQLIGTTEYRGLFSTYPPGSINTHADTNLLDAARALKFQHEKNVLVLTSDKKLTCDIFNACCTKSVVKLGGKVQVLYIDKLTGKLMRYHKSRLEELVDEVELPEWHLIGEPSPKPGLERYFHDAIFNASVIIDSCSLKYVFGNRPSLFMKNLKKTQALRPDQKFMVVSTSLYDSTICEAVKAMPQMFNIIQAAHPGMREEDAIHQAVIDMSATCRDLHILLISNKPKRYETIARKLPTCHYMKEFWGCFIEPNTGLLLKSNTKKDSANFFA